MILECQQNYYADCFSKKYIKCIKCNIIKTNISENCTKNSGSLKDLVV